MLVSMNIFQAFGQLISAEGTYAAEVDAIVPLIRPQDNIAMQQQFRVISNAENYKHFLITFSLYLEASQQSYPDAQDMVLVERHVVRLQVSSSYRHTPNAQFLLVTNSRTTEQGSYAIQNFIHISLGMEVDLCNVHQNGGLKYQPDAGGNPGLEESLPILQMYQAKLSCSWIMRLTSLVVDRKPQHDCAFPLG